MWLTEPTILFKPLNAFQHRKISFKNDLKYFTQSFQLLLQLNFLHTLLSKYFQTCHQPLSQVPPNCRSLLQFYLSNWRATSRRVTRCSPSVDLLEIYCILLRTGDAFVLRLDECGKHSKGAFGQKQRRQ